MKKQHLFVLFALASSMGWAKEKPVKMDDSKAFYVYAEKGSKKNHYIPSGWMGNYGDFKFDDANKTDCVDGLTCIKITYSSKNTQGAGWGGIYWVHPAGNWGEKSGGFDLSGFTRLTFWARADQDNVTINEFKMGGITGEFGDSDSASIGPITLTRDWKKYEIKFEPSANLKHIIGGFCFATANDVVPENGYSMYLDEVRYEK
jgi:hypothetical protein